MTSRFIPALLAALLLLSLVAPAAARPRTSIIADRSYSSSIGGRQIAAPPWSAACTTDHGPSECGEPMWIYGPRSEISQYKSAF